MLVNDFIKALRESRGVMDPGKPTGDGKSVQQRRDVPVAKMPARINAAEKPKAVAKPNMGDRKNQKPTANVGNVSGDGIAFSGRRQVKVEKVKEAEEIAEISLDDADLVLDIE